MAKLEETKDLIKRYEECVLKATDRALLDIVKSLAIIADKLCEVSEKDRSDNTYRLKYKDWTNEYSTTVFVKNDVLHPVDEAYNKGLEDAWELAKKIVLPDHLGGYTVDEIEDIFGKRTFASVLTNYTLQEVFAKVKAYKEKSNEIMVGDVVKVRGRGFESIVTKVDGHIIYRLFRDGGFNNVTKKEDLIKTGRHFDSIDEFMKS